MQVNRDAGDAAEEAGSDIRAAEQACSAEQLGIVIGDLDGGAVAVGERVEAEDQAVQAGSLPERTSTPPLLAGTGFSHGITIGRMTGGAVASGKEARAIHRSEYFFAATPELSEALAMLRDGAGELSAETARAEEEIETTGGVGQGRLRRIASLAAQAAGAVGGQTAAAVAAETINGMLS